MYLLSHLLNPSKGFSFKAKLILFRFAYYILNIKSIKSVDWDIPGGWSLKKMIIQFNLNSNVPSVY